MNSRNTLDSRVFKSLQVFVFYGVFKMVTIKIKTQQWNYSKSHTPGLKYTCTCSCTLHWHFHFETAPNPTLKLLQIPHYRTKTHLHLHFALTFPLWNYSKSHTQGLKYTCTCTSHWHSHSETTPNPTLQDWNISALVVVILRTGTSALKLLQIPCSRTETYLHLYFTLAIPLWNYSKSHAPRLKVKHTCTCTSHWQSNTGATQKPSLQDWNDLCTLVLHISNPTLTLRLLQIPYTRTETYLHYLVQFYISNPTLELCSHRFSLSCDPTCLQFCTKWMSGRTGLITIRISVILNQFLYKPWAEGFFNADFTIF